MLREQGLRAFGRHTEFYSGGRGIAMGHSERGLVKDATEVARPVDAPLVGEAELELQAAITGGFGESFAVWRAGQLIRLTEQR